MATAGAVSKKGASESCKSALLMGPKTESIFSKKLSSWSSVNVLDCKRNGGWDTAAADDDDDDKVGGMVDRIECEECK